MGIINKDIKDSKDKQNLENFYSSFVSCLSLLIRDIRVEAKKEGAHDAKIDTAINLLTMKILSPEQISQGTGLPLEEVLELRNSINSELQN